MKTIIKKYYAWDNLLPRGGKKRDPENETYHFFFSELVT